MRPLAIEQDDGNAGTVSALSLPPRGASSRCQEMGASVAAGATCFTLTSYVEKHAACMDPDSAPGFSMALDA